MKAPRTLKALEREAAERGVEFDVDFGADDPAQVTISMYTPTGVMFGSCASHTLVTIYWQTIPGDRQKAIAAAWDDLQFLQPCDEPGCEICADDAAV